MVLVKFDLWVKYTVEVSLLPAPFPPLFSGVLIRVSILTRDIPGMLPPLDELRISSAHR